MFIVVFCNRCGSENFDDARYCQECGNPINKVKRTIADEHVVNEKTKLTLTDNKTEKIDSELRNSGILTLGLGVFLSLFSIYAGIITIFFGALLLLIKKVEILAVVGAIILIFGLYNLSFGSSYGIIQILMAATFFYSFYKYSYK